MVEEGRGMMVLPLLDLEELLGEQTLVTEELGELVVLMVTVVPRVAVVVPLADLLDSILSIMVMLHGLLMVQEMEELVNNI